MSFQNSLKSQILEHYPAKNKYLFPFEYALLLMGKAFSLEEMSLVTGNREVCSRYCDVIVGVTGKLNAVRVEETTIAGGQTLYVAAVAKAIDRKALITHFGHIFAEPFVAVNTKSLTGKTAVYAFVAGAYLSCGTVTTPEKGYHLEFVHGNKILFKAFLEILKRVEPRMKDTIRKGEYVAYLKDSERIENMLGKMGATNALLELMEVKIVKDVRNRINRITNCETANIDKTIAASARQIEDIDYILEKRDLTFLPERLRELAQLRVENPELSMTELGNALSTPLGRSGVNHRLAKISAIAEELRKREGQ